MRLNFSNHRIVDITECEWKDLCILLLGSHEKVTVPPAGLAYGCVHIGETPGPSAEEYDRQWKEVRAKEKASHPMPQNHASREAE